MGSELVSFETLWTLSTLYFNLLALVSMMLHNCDQRRKLLITKFAVDAMKLMIVNFFIGESSFARDTLDLGFNKKVL